MRQRVISFFERQQSNQPSPPPPHFVPPFFFSDFVFSTPSMSCHVMPCRCVLLTRRAQTTQHKKQTGKLGVIASEEEDHPVLVEEAFNSKFVAVFDPLDGSSNIDAAISTGTIFGIFEETEVRCGVVWCGVRHCTKILSTRRARRLAEPGGYGCGGWWCVRP